ncbi:DNA-binding transcriptional MerR regulator [Kitasatospora sp. GAS204A]|uniref:MerR family transcriptional regulator n=1 Tax=unclassified Kitasatospora TaxID=2633591 RepID=UPI0024765519|nr:MerR family transcriptional regulator [Kitasatospora sp. GAS204B]MDH6116185.1 DNA-binding transcriptional MerR regulator [Kitasatospora sp. GAS204B]
MDSTMPIGDFSRATHLSVKMLRHYHEVGLLEPVEVDVDSGYRRYAAEQIVKAQIIRRFRDLEMPLDDIQIVLQAPDVETRNRVIANHLTRLESSLARTQETVASLRGLLDRPQDSTVAIDHRHVAAAPAAAITDTVDQADVVAWYRGAMGEVAATLSAQSINPAGPLGGVYDTELFTEGRGRVTIFLPSDPLPQQVGRVSTTVIPPAELATIVHLGSSTEVDRTYGALADYVTRHALAVDGPIREYYLVGPSDTPDESLWQTEIGWPIFRTRPRP